MSKIYFLSFCNIREGATEEERKSLLGSLGNIRLLLDPYFDDLWIYDRESLKSLPGSDNFCNPLGDILNLNPGISSVGSGDFKPFLIDYTLKNIEEGSILIYHDCNFSKYPQYWQTQWGRIKETCEYLLDINGSDFFSPFEADLLDGNPPLVGMHGKRYTSDKILDSKEDSDIVSGCFEIASSRMIVRNTEKSREFFREYKNLCEDKSLLMRNPDPEPYQNFTHLCPEQHVYNCLIYKYILDGKLNISFPTYYFVDRRLIIEKYARYRINHKLWKYMGDRKIKRKEPKSIPDGKDIRGSQKFREDIFST
jgi:hypothetical protein